MHYSEVRVGGENGTPGEESSIHILESFAPLKSCMISDRYSVGE